MSIHAIPAPDAAELDWLLFEQSEVLTWQQARGTASRGRIRHLVASGRWQRVSRSVLVASPGELSRGQQLWVAVLAAGPGAVLAGPTAALEAGVRGLRREPIHVLLPSARAAPDLRRLPLGMPGVMVRRTTWLPGEHVQVGRPARTTTPRSVVDTAQWARTDDEGRVRPSPPHASNGG